MPSALLALCLPAAASHVNVGIGFGFPLAVPASPPPVIVVRNVTTTEVIPPAPGPDYIWIAGHWEWDTPNRRWVWSAATWQRRPTPEAVWQPGHWQQAGNAWEWIGSTWVVPSAAPTPSAESPPPAPPANPPTTNSEVVVEQAPPAPMVEQIYSASGPDYVWLSGCWIWSGGWVWAPGHHVRRPYPGAVWVGPRWEPHGGHRYLWVEGRWR